MPKSRYHRVERRAKPRIQKAVELQLKIRHEEKITCVYTRDIALHGLCCYLPIPLDLYTKYGFHLIIPLENGYLQEIEGEGIVVRVEEIEQDGQIVFETALYFQNMDEKTRATLEDFLEGIDDHRGQ